MRHTLARERILQEKVGTTPKASPTCNSGSGTFPRGTQSWTCYFGASLSLINQPQHCGSWLRSSGLYLSLTANCVLTGRHVRTAADLIPDNLDEIHMLCVAECYQPLCGGLGPRFPVTLLIVIVT